MIPIVILLLVLGVGLYLYLPKQMKDDNDFTGVVVVEEKDTFEPKTADFAQRRANEYWGNNVFDDFSANYDLMCEEIKTLVDKETFVQKYKEDREERPLAKPERVEIGETRLEEDTAIVRVAVFTLVYDKGTSSTTELLYENGRWCKLLKPSTIEWLTE